jgi:DNA (cytosine-5)-methyltransferase 1
MNDDRRRDLRRIGRVPPAEDEPHLPPGRSRLSAASIFSGGGGLDLGFELAGFSHVVSCDILPRACETLLAARPSWNVVCRDAREVDWDAFRADVLHGGPPCTPYSTAGWHLGHLDGRDMLPVFVDAVLACRPRAYVMENVAGICGGKFQAHLEGEFGRLRRAGYSLASAVLDAAGFGVPQRRCRAFFVGFPDPADARAFAWPVPSGVAVGAREALGLEPGEADGPAPTIRSGLTGPRHTTSVLSSASAARAWRSLGLWPNGVQRSREEADRYPAPDGTRRLSVAECALLQGFPEDWPFQGASYMRLGLIGNSVPPPLARSVASAVAAALRRP